ncbi:MAG: phage integrase SAM-like domain-containing protein [Ekhidna sp.]
MKITLRKRERKTRTSLYLDIYDGGARKQEPLDLHLYKPNGKALTPAQKRENKDILELAERVRAQKLLDYQNGKFGFTSISNANKSFVRYMEGLAADRINSKGNYGNWDSAIKHLKKYLNDKDVKFSKINKEWLAGFKNYLEKEAIAHGNKPLSQNSKSCYFNKIRAALKEAFRDKLINIDVVGQVKSIKAGEPDREYLTEEEVELLKNTECEMSVLKDAFLFSCRTGMRWSDIQNLKWGDIRKDEGGHSIKYQQKKTKGQEILPITDNTLKHLGKPGAPDEKVFRGLKYSAWNNLKLREWVMQAGIKKKITFHCARHTCATLNLYYGNDITIVKEILGQKHVKTTEIYVKVMNKSKRDAVNKISI